jgi:hypothetical protein
VEVVYPSEVKVMEQEEDVEEAYGSSTALLQEPCTAWVALVAVCEARSL